MQYCVGLYHVRVAPRKPVLINGPLVLKSMTGKPQINFDGIFAINFIRGHKQNMHYKNCHVLDSEGEVPFYKLSHT